MISGSRDPDLCISCPKYIYASTISSVVLFIRMSFLSTSSLYITLVFAKFILRPTLLLAVFSSLICACSSSGLLAIRTMSSANLRWLRYSPCIFNALLVQSSCRKISSSVAVNSFGDIASPQELWGCFIYNIITLALIITCLLLVYIYSKVIIQGF